MKFSSSLLAGMEEFKEAEGKAEAEGEAAVEEFFPIKSTAGGAGLASASASLEAASTSASTSLVAVSSSASASLVAVQVVRPSKTSKGIP